jgi:hypothetical protein
LPEKGEIFLHPRELVASSFYPRPCDKKTTAAVKFQAAPILPFMALITPGPVAIPNRDRRHSD